MTPLRRLPFHWSTLMVLGFAGLLAMVGFFAEVFQAPRLPQEMVQLVRNPLSAEKLRRVKRLSFSNRAGQFHFENTHPEGLAEGPWKMTSPTSTRARRDFFVKVLAALSELQVRHVHGQDTINLKSFSLDKPLFTLVVEPVGSSPWEITFGLVNPIDDSTYFTVQGQEWIYQSNALPLSLDTVTPEELIDARALAFSAEKLDGVEIVSLNGGPGLAFHRTGDEWRTSQGMLLNPKRVDQFLSELHALKGYMVLDKLTPEQEARLREVAAAPERRLRLGQEGTSETWFLSPSMDRLGDLRFERSGSVLLWREGTLSPIVLGREQLGVFGRKERDLR